MITLGLLAACAPSSEPEPSWFSEERTWSDAGSAGRAQHHATVVALGGLDEVAAVGWTDGESWEEPRAVVRWLSAEGGPGAQHTLGGGESAQKPDLDRDADAVLAGFQSPGAVQVERVEADTALRRVVATVPELDDNNSVDLAVWQDGRIVVVWYEADDLVGTYRAATLGPDLEDAEGLATEVATTDHKNAASPDVDVDLFGHVAIAWVDQPFDAPVTLVLDGWSDDGVLGWRTVVATQEGEPSPRRPTVVARDDGSFVVGWRTRAETPPVPSTTSVAAVDADGALLGPPVGPDGETDELVIAPAGDDVWAVWTEITNPTTGGGIIWGGVLSVPDGAWTVGPIRLSDSDTGASRPHTDTHLTADGLLCAVSWEQWAPAGATIHGRVGRIPLP